MVCYPCKVDFQETSYKDAFSLSGIVLRAHFQMVWVVELGRGVGLLRSGKRVSIFNDATSLSDTAA
jgi:hypothetical protein